MQKLAAALRAPAATRTRVEGPDGLPARSHRDRALPRPSPSAPDAPAPDPVEPGATGPDLVALDRAVADAAAALRTRQRADGHWVFELEADATIPAEYVMLRHFFGRPDPAREARIGRYLRRLQAAHGGWPLFHGGPLDVSASVKAYFALRLIGDDPEAPHMRRARRAVLAAGGAARSNVFTRAQLALWGEVPWSAVPVMPPEILLLPRWFPFHLDRISYWARTVLVPLTVVMARRPRAANPRGVTVRELFREPPEAVRRWPGGDHQAQPWAGLFRGLDAVLQRAHPRFPHPARRRAEAAAERFVTERLNGEDGLGAIFPAMVNAILMYHCLGVPDSDPRVAIAWRAVEKLVVDRDDAAGTGGEEAGGDGETYVQPCLSPVWDTALAAHALLEAGAPADEAAAAAGLSWLLDRQVTTVAGDWAVNRPGLAPGGWAFQYANPHYPDVDDTAVVVLALDRAGRRGLLEADAARLPAATHRATAWVEGMQSRGGGWGAFDADNTHHYLNHIPFADHGALLDPPTSDVSARCLGMLAQLGRPMGAGRARRGLDWLLAEQEADGSWYGRWGVNYVYGTWSALAALNAAGLGPDHPAVRRGADWLTRAQNPDGGWGEAGGSYGLSPRRRPRAASTPSQTAWALLGLMAAGRAGDPAVDRGAAWLLAHRTARGDWDEPDHTGTGFPRVFYLRYHGYARIFPLWALARLRTLRRANDPRVAWGL